MTPHLPLPTAAPSRIFYGWRIAVVGGLANLISAGLVLYSIGVFVYPFEQEFGWTRAQVSFATSVVFIVAGIAGPIVGRLNDRYGPRPLMMIGAVIIGLGIASLSRVGTLWQLYLGFAIAALGRNSTGHIALGALMTNWFSRRRGLALGITWAGGSLGGVLMVPLASVLVGWLGWRSAFLILALLAWTVALPAIALVVRSRPADLGLTPDGLPPAKPLRSTISSGGHDWPVGRAMRTPTFWFLTIGLGIAFAAHVALSVHLVPYLIGVGLEPQSAAALAGISAAFGAAGRFLGGWAIDWFKSARRVLVVAIVLEAVGLGVLVVADPSTPLIWLFFLLYGIGSGTPPAIEPALVAESFGLRGLGSLLGVMGIFQMASLVTAPVLVGLAYDLLHSYTVPFAILAGLCAVGAFAALFARPVGPADRPA